MLPPATLISSRLWLTFAIQVPVHHSVTHLPMPCAACCPGLPPQSFLLMRLSVVRPIETRKFIAVSRQVSADAAVV
jgi:hypothetical protein